MVQGRVMIQGHKMVQPIRSKLWNLLDIRLVPIILKAPQEFLSSVPLYSAAYILVEYITINPHHDFVVLMQWQKLSDGTGNKLDSILSWAG